VRTVESITPQVLDTFPSRGARRHKQTSNHMKRREMSSAAPHLLRVNRRSRLVNGM